MSEMREYEALVDFSLNMDNGKTTINVKAGDSILFDGLYAECRGERGQVRTLSKVIGEWIKPVGGEDAPVVSSSVSARSVTASRVVENSSAESDHDVIAQQKKPQIINSDETEVSKTSMPSQSSNNIGGVQIKAQETRKASIISHEERTVKKTAYAPDRKEDSGVKHIKVDKEATGIEVRKVKVPAITKEGARSSTATHAEVSHEERVAKQTTYEKVKGTVVGSSTQASVVATKTENKKKIVSDSSDDATVVGKVSRIKETDVVTEDGFKVKMTVGAPTVSDDDIEMGEITFSGSNEPITDLSSPQNDGDIDVDDILKEL